MVDVYQVTFEYSAGNSVTFKTDNLTITYDRPFLSMTPRSDGAMIVTDAGVGVRSFAFSATITGAEANTLDGVLMAAIDYTGAYPRITVINWSGAATETNVEVFVTRNGCSLRDMGSGEWLCTMKMMEKTR